MNSSKIIKSVAPEVQTWDYVGNRPAKPLGFKEPARPRYEKIGLGKRLVVEPTSSDSGMKSVIEKPNTEPNKPKDNATEEEMDEDWLKGRAIWLANGDANWEAGRAAWLKKRAEKEAAWVEKHRQGGQQGAKLN